MTPELPRHPDIRTENRVDLPAPRDAVDDAVLRSAQPAFGPADVDELRRSVAGPVLVAGEVAAWNVAVQHTPAIAVGATCAADVVAAVSWAVAHGLKVAVQATGHGPVRNAAGSLMITTRRMQGIHIDPRRG